MTSSDFSSSEKNSIKNQTLAQFPGVTFLADATLIYNCHGYAWHFTDGQGNVVWINAINQGGGANISKYWTDGSFIQVCNESEADKIHYYSGDHTAVKSTVAGKYESKWGSGIRVRHGPTEVPSGYNGSSRQYYASTKITGDAGNLCTGTRVFSVKNIPGATYSWSYSSTITPIGATNTNQITVQRNGSSQGAAWVQVQISTSCSGSSATSR